MNPFKTFAAAKALGLGLVAGPAVAAAPAAPLPPAGVYIADKAHTSVTFRVSHLGFSHYTARFTGVEGTLRFDPAHPTAMSVQATIDPMSLDLSNPPKGFHEQLTGKGWLEAAQFPKIVFKSTKVEPTGPRTARVTGDFTMHGVTKPVVLDATYNGGWTANVYDGNRVGFSGHTVLKRSAFGISQGIPAPGTTMGVSDDVDVAIEAEFANGKPTGPAAAAKK